MYGMRPVSLARGLIRKLHHSAQLITLPTRRIISPHPRFENLRDLALQFSYLCDDVYLLLLRHPRLKSKRKHVYVHLSLPSIWKVFNFATSSAPLLHFARFSAQLHPEEFTA